LKKSTQDRHEALCGSLNCFLPAIDINGNLSNRVLRPDLAGVDGIVAGLQLRSGFFNHRRFMQNFNDAIV
jgi:hypothetical protein